MPLHRLVRLRIGSTGPPQVSRESGRISDRPISCASADVAAGGVPVFLPRARLVLPVAARRARLQRVAGGEVASWPMALMSASVVVVNGAVLRAARLRTAAPSNAEMVRSARAAARAGSRPH